MPVPSLHSRLLAELKRGIQVATSIMGLKTHVKWLTTEKLKAPPPSNNQSSKAAGMDDLHPIEILPEDTSFIQYSSGSTGGAPKGVILRHQAIVHNIMSVQRDLIWTNEKNSGVVLMPQYHDYEWLYFTLLPCLTPSIPIYACSPLDFVRSQPTSLRV
jgi:acyl-CoA synthetase (AMP-forming)/AMP-acid ligase II